MLEAVADRCPDVYVIVDERYQLVAAPHDPAPATAPRSATARCSP